TDRRYTFPLKQRHAVRYRHHKVVLAGDAAHTIHPLAGQGVNLGFADAQELVGLLKEKSATGLQNLNLGSLLATYERHRQPRNLAMMALMEGFKRVFDTQHPVMRWARNVGIGLLQDSPQLKKQIMRVVGS
ncbi:MAG: FAD-dependent monooxygenase, partial [Gammaproteobacteria bacterium]|nr:FAD-dependent monooxygenase [Gammaproteobacteria bacterium]